MIIALAQSKVIKGDIEKNVKIHEEFIKQGIEHGAQLIVFPELSLTGYEPTLANDLAMDFPHAVFDRFQQLCDQNNIAVALGAPLKARNGVSIGMPILRPKRSPVLYFKKYLHSDEFPFFTSGPSIDAVELEDMQIAFAICFEISVAEHELNTFKGSPQIYIASVVKSVNGTPSALERLSKLSSKYGIPVLMVNSVGISDGFICGGRSSVWSNAGTLLGQLGETDPAMLLFNTVTGECIYSETRK